MKKILFITRMAPFTPGGARKVIWELGKYMSKKNWEVHYLYGSPHLKPPCMPNIYFHPIITPEHYLKMSYAFILKGAIIYPRVIKMIKPDIIYDNTNPFPFMPAYLLSRGKIITRIHHVLRGKAFQFKSGFLNPIHTCLFEEFYRILDGEFVIVDSYSTKQRVASLIKNSSKITIIPPGINLKAIKPSFSEKRINGLVISICRMAASKGIEYLLKAWKIIESTTKNGQLKLAGKGPQEKEFRKLAIKLNLRRVEFLGFISEAQKIDLLKKASVFVLPTLVEGLPIGILEAMACGIPIVSTNTFGVRDLIKDGKNGILVEPKNPSELADAILYMLKHKNKAERLAKASWQKVQDFSLDKVNHKEMMLLEEKMLKLKRI